MTYPWGKPYRNIAVTLRVLRGEPATALAKQHGISRRRVAQIAHRVCRKAEPALYAEVTELESAALGPLVANAARFVEVIGRGKVAV